ncbi:MAG TPA: AI-2E family transporter [Mycobacteriales bacterium]|nr:AI-2E family transporter [Mycobacteriales bacterium]
MSDDQAAATGSPLPVPPLLRDLAGWTWRLLILALGGFLVVELLDRLYFLVLPFFGALFATSLAWPVVVFLRRKGVPRALATWLTVLLALVVFGGIAVFVIDRAVSQYSDLVDQVSATVTKFQHFLTVDLHIKSSSTSSIEKTITTYLNQHKSSIASGTLSGIRTVGEGLAALVLWFFMTFFLLYDGENIWNWLKGLFPQTAHHRVHRAGEHAWARLAGFVRGTFIIALFHGVVAGVTLAILGVPLATPLAVLVFFGSFLPIVGSILFGGLAVAITLVTQGWVFAIILVAVLLVDNQIEAHVLQPFLVGRYVRLHPLAVAVAIAGGTLLEGIYGAILAVPFLAVAYAVARYLFVGDEDGPGGPAGADVPGEDDDAPPAEDRLVPEAE